MASSKAEIVSFRENFPQIPNDLGLFEDEDGV